MLSTAVLNIYTLQTQPVGRQFHNWVASLEVQAGSWRIPVATFLSVVTKKSTLGNTVEEQETRLWNENSIHVFSRKIHLVGG